MIAGIIPPYMCHHEQRVKQGRLHHHPIYHYILLLKFSLNTGTGEWKKEFVLKLLKWKIVLDISTVGERESVSSSPVPRSTQPWKRWQPAARVYEDKRRTSVFKPQSSSSYISDPQLRLSNYSEKNPPCALYKVFCFHAWKRWAKSKDSDCLKKKTRNGPYD